MDAIFKDTAREVVDALQATPGGPQPGFAREQMRQVCPSHAIARVLEKGLDLAPDEQEAKSFFENRLFSVHKASDALGHHACDDFDMTAHRKTTRGDMFNRDELLWALDRVAARPEVLMGIFLLQRVMLNYAEKGQELAEEAGAPHSIQSGFDNLTGIGQTRALSLLPFAAALGGWKRDAPDDAAADPQGLVEGLRWAYRCGGFRNKTPLYMQNCPGGLLIIKTFTLPLFAGATKEGPACWHYMEKAAKLIASDACWQKRSVDVSRQCLKEKERVLERAAPRMAKEAPSP